MMRPALLLLLFTPVLALGQKADRRVVKALQTDVAALSAATTGSPEDRQKAADYLVARYEKLKIPPVGTAYRHPFQFTSGRDAGASRIVLGGQSNLMGGEAFPLPFSGTGTVTGEVLIEVQEQGAIWMLPLYESAEAAADPAFDWEAHALATAKQATQDGATGIVFYDSYGASRPPRFNPMNSFEPVKIPLAFVGHRQWQELSAADANMISVSLDIRVETPERSANNISARIDNNAERTIVIAARYDDAQPTKSPDPAAHDDVTGTAGVLQLAEWLKRSRLRGHNYVFVHYSGSGAEPGHLNCLRFCSQSGLDCNKIAAIIRLNAIGALNDSTRALVLNDHGTPATWNTVLQLLRQAKFNPEPAPVQAIAAGETCRPTLGIATPSPQAPHAAKGLARPLNLEGEASILKTIQNLLRHLDGEAIADR